LDNNSQQMCHGSVHHSIIHTERANKMQQFIKIYYSIFIWSSTCFGRNTAHHQELKTALAASGFAYVKGCWTLRLLNADSSNGVTITRCCRYICLRSWCWVMAPPKYVEQFPDKINCVTLHLFGYILECCFKMLTKVLSN